MPFLPFERTPIAQRVSDRHFGDQVLCQVATWSALHAHVDPTTHEVSIVVETRVDFYTSVAGELGERIPVGNGLASRQVPLFANNNCAVYFNPTDPTDERNGEVLYYKTTLPAATPTAEPQVAWQRREPDGALSEPLAPTDLPEPLLLQGDAFALQLEYPLVLANLIRHHIAAADAPPFSKYA